MTFRIGENQATRAITSYMNRNKEAVNRYSRELSTGLRVFDPGDSPYAATIQVTNNQIDRFEGYNKAISTSKMKLEQQSGILDEANGLVIRAMELATQAANETNSYKERAQIAPEVFEIREALVQLANSKFSGQYLWHGTNIDTPPFIEDSYTTPATGPESRRYVFDDSTLGATDISSINITDSLEVQINSRGDDVWGSVIGAVERLGRALVGYTSDPATTSASTLPDGNGTQLTLPDDFSTQTAEIINTIDLLKESRETSIQLERVSLGGRVSRIENAENLVENTIFSAKELLSSLRDANFEESASNLAMARTGLEATYAIISQILNLSIIDYL